MGIVADRVKETTTTTGTGTYTLDGTTATWQTFSAGVAAIAGTPSPMTWAAVNYLCIQSDASGNNIDIEIGTGTLTDGGTAKDTLTRDAILFSSNGGAAVDWSAGTKTIVNTAQAGDLGSAHFWVLSKTADQTNFTEGAATKVVWEGINTSKGVTVDIATNERITANVAGNYYIAFESGWNPDNSGNVQVMIYKNGAYFTGVVCSFENGNNKALGIASIVNLAATDYVEIWIKNVSTGNSSDLLYTGITSPFTSIDTTWGGYLMDV